MTLRRGLSDRTRNDFIETLRMSTVVTTGAVILILAFLAMFQFRK